MFANVLITGELIFTMVIGVVAFIFPLLLLDLEADKIRTFVFVFLYLTGPVNVILNGFPQITRIKISWGRIEQLQRQLADLAVPGYRKSQVGEPISFRSLTLNNVCYSYQDKGTKFVIGPINYTFQAGKIVFITGGNGSGKSTLTKLLCGLYVPKHGEITVNQTSIQPADLSQLFAAVFSDYHLFDKMYGINHAIHTDAIAEYLRILQLTDKITVTNGSFSTTQLSTGQKKRLALLVCYLEDKPIYLFDEWAADQDPVFKRFFYEELLLGLKMKGKCVIVVSHDDRYFHVADETLIMESGKMVHCTTSVSEHLVKEVNMPKL